MSCCPSCGSDVGLRTRHIRMVRGTTLKFSHIVRDDVTNQPIDLTGAKVELLIRADMKIDATVKLTTEAPAPATWRTGIVIDNQVSAKGQFTVTIIPADTAGLVALGHDDPWFYDVKVTLGAVIRPEIATSELDIYP